MGKQICVAAKAGGDAMHRRSSIEEDFEVVGELASVSAQIVFKCFYRAGIGRPVAKWTIAYGQRLARLMRCIHCTLGNGHRCYVGKQFEHSKLGLF